MTRQKSVIFINALLVAGLVLVILWMMSTNLKSRKPVINVEEVYLDLLSKFPIEAQGYGLDSFGPVPSHQPMTYGLILSSESLRYSKNPSEMGARRIRGSVKWLSDNADTDEDGFIGWGLPNAWDAFSDGSPNPKNHPYTITTAIVLQGMLDALKINNFWTDEERNNMLSIIKSASTRWCTDVWSTNASGGYFWYSPSKEDKVFTVNASSMMLGSISRLVSEQGKSLSDVEKAMFVDRIEKASKSIINAAQLRNGLPFWDYLIIEGDLKIKNRPNDLVHHSYILWGLEVYRETFGDDSIPWSKEQSLVSLSNFRTNNKIYEFPTHLNHNKDRPARVWGVGMMLAHYAKNNMRDGFYEVLEILLTQYSNTATVSLYPRNYDTNTTFLPRYVAHVLYGIANMYR